jgi:transcriptional regulator with XRE-family HTH domain
MKVTRAPRSVPPTSSPAADGLGAVLRRYRQAAGISQSCLADGAGVDHGHVSRIESGSRAASRETLLRCATVLGLSADERDDLLQAAGLAPANQTFRRLIVLFAACGDPARRRIADLLLEQAILTLSLEALRYDD